VKTNSKPFFTLFYSLIPQEIAAVD